MNATDDPGLIHLLPTEIGVSNPHEPDVLRIHWSTGGCHEDPTIELERVGEGVRLTLWTGPPCMNQQYGERRLDLAFERPMPAAMVDATRIDRYRVEPSATPGGAP